MKQRTLPKKLEADFFNVHQSIVYGCLRQLNIFLNHPHYDDFKQVGLMALVEAYETFPKQLHNEEHFYHFTGFAFQKVKWKILDEVRKQATILGREQAMERDLLNVYAEQSADTENNRILFLLLESMASHLNQNEQDYLYETIFNQLTVTEFAKKKGVSRKTVYEWKKKIAIKLKNYKKVIRS
jgi:RNA polymerase sigma factor (sigma-70 family)